jgi:hypothetical protein
MFPIFIPVIILYFALVGLDPRSEYYYDVRFTTKPTIKI